MALQTKLRSSKGKNGSKPKNYNSMQEELRSMDKVYLVTTLHTFWEDAH